MTQSTNYSIFSERVLVVLAQTCDGEAFQQLVISYQGRLTYYIRRLIGRPDEAEDVIQEVWLVVHRKLATLRSPEAFRVWLYKIAHDVAVSHLRRVSRLPRPMSEELAKSDAVEHWDEFEAMANAELVSVRKPLWPCKRGNIFEKLLEDGNHLGDGGFNSIGKRNLPSHLQGAKTCEKPSQLSSDSTAKRYQKSLSI